MLICLKHSNKFCLKIYCLRVFAASLELLLKIAIFLFFPLKFKKYMSEALVDLSKRISKLIPKQIQDIFLNIKNTSVTIFYTITHGYQ